jgi:hypothetical protein
MRAIRDVERAARSGAGLIRASSTLVSATILSMKVASEADAAIGCGLS